MRRKSRRFIINDGEEYIAGIRGIRFQGNSEKMTIRKPGEPVPEAIGFKNIRSLVRCGKLVIAEKKASPKPEPKPEPRPSFFKKSDANKKDGKKKPNKK